MRFTIRNKTKIDKSKCYWVKTKKKKKKKEKKKKKKRHEPFAIVDNFIT